MLVGTNNVCEILHAKYWFLLDPAKTFPLWAILVSNVLFSTRSSTEFCHFVWACQKKHCHNRHVLFLPCIYQTGDQYRLSWALGFYLCQLSIGSIIFVVLVYFIDLFTRSMNICCFFILFSGPFIGSICNYLLCLNYFICLSIGLIYILFIFYIHFCILIVL